MLNETESFEDELRQSLTPRDPVIDWSEIARVRAETRQLASIPSHTPKATWTTWWSGVAVGVATTMIIMLLGRELLFHTEPPIPVLEAKLIPKPPDSKSMDPFEGGFARMEPEPSQEGVFTPKWSSYLMQSTTLSISRARWKTAVVAPDVNWTQDAFPRTDIETGPKSSRQLRDDLINEFH
jgi:hypothetical protein